MKTNLSELTIISITYNNNGIQHTIDSVLPIINAGGKMVIQNGGKELKLDHISLAIHNEKDTGIYDAINKGIGKVQTKFFMILHAGDILIGDTQDISDIMLDMESFNKDMSLNSQYIGSRLHSSVNWRPWMLFFGVQPPHLPVIYKSKIYKEIKYSLDIPIIADFDFFLKEVNWKNVLWSNKILVKMATDGATSGGIKSFFLVSKCFANSYGIRGIFMAIARIPFKVIQAIY
jgi:hypothetical protein